MKSKGEGKVAVKEFIWDGAGDGGGALWSGRVEQRECKGKEGAWWRWQERGVSQINVIK